MRILLNTLNWRLIQEQKINPDHLADWQNDTACLKGKFILLNISDWDTLTEKLSRDLVPFLKSHDQKRQCKFYKIFFLLR